MKHRMYLVLAMLVLLALVGSIFSIDCAAPAPKEPIKIGVILGLTGYMADADSYSKKAVDLYAETMNPEINGRPVQFIIEDDATDPSQSMDKARKLIDVDKVCMTIGPTDSGCATADLGYNDRMEVPNLAISCHSAPIPRTYKWVWLPRGIDRACTYAMGVFMYEVDGIRTAVGMYPDFVCGHDTADGFREGFESRGGKVVQEQFFPPDVKDFAPYIAKIEKADALVGMFSAVGAYTQIEEFGIKIPKYIYFSVLEAPAIQQEVDIGYGWNVVTPWSYAVDAPGTKEFVAAYEKKYGEKPYEEAGDMWSDIQIAMDVLKRTGGDTSSDKLEKALNETNLVTVTGLISFGLDHIAANHFYAFRFEKVGGVWEHKIVGEYEVKVTGHKGETYALEAVRIK